MKFCTSCGSPLEFFEFLDGELCSSCLKNKQSAGKTGESAPTVPENKPHESFADLEGAVLSFEDGKLTLKSAEGWVLWSGPANEAYRLETVLERAQRILKIRTKRNKN